MRRLVGRWRAVLRQVRWASGRCPAASDDAFRRIGGKFSEPSRATPPIAVAPPPPTAGVASQPPDAPQLAAPYPGARAPVPPPWSLPPTPPGGGGQNRYGGPTAGYNVGGAPGAAARPTGIAILAILEVAGGLLGLIAAKALFDYADLHNYLYGSGGQTAQFLGLASAAGAIAAFILAWGLWSVRPWAWLLGCALSVISAAFAILSLVGGGEAVSAMINVGVDAAVLYYLNTNEIRALFGRPPSTFMTTRR